MKVIAHISDLHFGREDPRVADGLAEDLQDIRPDLVVNSGDFTQRARRRQYQAAAHYMRRLPKPQLSVPGNHDIPLFDVVRRFSTPLKRYRNYISDEMYPTFIDQDLAVLGINTARSLTWKSGRISVNQINEIDKVFRNTSSAHFKVIVTHHPFIPPPGEEDAGVDLVGRAARALEVITRSGVDLLLAGHLHHGYTGDVRTYYPKSKRSIIVAQAGTAISNRMRSEPNGYNLIRIKQGHLEIEIRVWDTTAFKESEKLVYRKDGDQWILQ